jgi:hypothetical protein
MNQPEPGSPATPFIVAAVILALISVVALRAMMGWHGMVWVGGADYSDMIAAIRSNDVSKVNRILDEYPWMINGPVPGEVGSLTPLHEAASTRKADVARALLVRGANVNARFTLDGSPGYTPLDLAIFAGDAAMVKFLLANGADPLLKTADGRSPAQLAEQAGGEDVVRELRAAEKK